MGQDSSRRFKRGIHMPRLTGKIAIITGAARGIGAAVARAFVAEGATVFLTDIADEPGSAAATALGANAHYLRLDVSEEADWERTVATVLDRYQRLDVLVNNAGITGFDEGLVAHDPEHASLHEWRRVHRTNLDGVFLGCRYAIRAMRKRGTGAIINMSSRSGLVGIPGAAAYASSKAAVRNHTKTVALYCAEQGLNIRCNSIHPGAVLTPMWDAILGSGPERESRMRAFSAETPLRRFGQPEEVAAIAVMLASDEVAYMTGAEINVDGGLLAGTVAAPKQAA